MGLLCEKIPGIAKYQQIVTPSLMLKNKTMKIKLTLALLVLTMNLLAQKGWQFQNSDLSNNEYGAIYALNKDTVFVIADQGVFIKTYDGGSTWTTENTGFSEQFYDISFLDPETGFCVGQNGRIIKTIDGGMNWTLSASGVTKNLFSICIKAADEIWAVGDSGLILNSTDYGVTWNANSLIDKRLNSIGFKGNTGIIAGNDGTILKSINSGANWIIENPTTTKDLFSLCITPNYAYALSGWVTDESDYYLYNAEEIVKTEDFLTWRTATPLPSPGASNMSFVNDTVGFNLASYCTTNGDCRILIFKTSDSADSWNASLDRSPPAWPGINYSDFSFVNDTIVYGLCGNNILKTTDGGVFVSMKKIKESHSINMYPNPLSCGLLHFESENSGNIGLEIFDTNGTLLIKSKLNGLSEVMDVSILSNGVYMVKLSHVNGQTETRKLIVLQ